MITIIAIKIIFDVTVPGDKRIGEKENEKVEKYHDLKLKEKLQGCGTRDLSGWYHLLWDYKEL